MAMSTKLSHVLLVIVGNVVVFLLLFVFLELAYRIHVDGFSRAFINIWDRSGVPYSNLGTSNLVIYDAELGYRLNPQAATINSRSVKHAEIVVPKPKDLYRIIVLGDSIPWDDGGGSFVNFLRDQIGGHGRYEVINAGVPGYTSYQELIFFKRYLLDTTPDLVIWSYCLNDNHKFLHQFNEKGRMLITAEAQETLRVRTAGDFIVSRSYLLSSLQIKLMALKEQRRTSGSPFVWERRSDVNVAWKDDTWPAYENYLTEMIRLLAPRNTKLVVVIFPFEPQLKFRHDAANYDYAIKPQRHLSALCRLHGVDCLDLYTVFGASYDRGVSLFQDGIHLNDQGFQLAAATIQQFLLDKRILPVRNLSTAMR